MTPEFEDKIIDKMVGCQFFFTLSTVRTLYDEIISLRSKLEMERLKAIHEREACAKIAEEWAGYESKEIAKEIRARSKK